jgi:hypothetical protein
LFVLIETATCWIEKKEEGYREQQHCHGGANDVWSDTCMLVMPLNSAQHRRVLDLPPNCFLTVVECIPSVIFAPRTFPPSNPILQKPRRVGWGIF